MAEEKTWTLEDLETHIKVNVKDYSAAIVCAALFKMKFGVMPKIGLSGFQAEAAQCIINKMFPEDK